MPTIVTMPEIVDRVKAIHTDVIKLMDAQELHPFEEASYQKVPAKASGVYQILDMTGTWWYGGTADVIRSRIRQHARPLDRRCIGSTFQKDLLEEEYARQLKLTPIKQRGNILLFPHWMGLPSTHKFTAEKLKEFRFRFLECPEGSILRNIIEPIIGG